MKRTRLCPTVLLALACALATPLQGQRTRDLPGQVVDVATRQGVSGAVLRILGTSVTAVTREDGRFVLLAAPEGHWTLRVEHLAYGVHDHDVTLPADQAMELEIRIASEAIELEPIVVETETQRERMERGQGSSRHVVERAQIERALGTSKHLGDLIVQTVPGVKMRQANNLAGTEVCLEFRGAASISLLQTHACSSPMVLLDGVPVSDPRYLYGTFGLQNIERIQVIPPGEAGARYGTGSLYGVILIDTRPPGNSTTTRAPGDLPMTSLPAPRLAFDWSQDPAGHDTFRTVAGAFVGNALGLVAGLAVARRCIDIDEKAEIVTSCGGVGIAGSGAAAFVLPALGGAMGARWGGGTSTSVGRMLPAVIGAGMMLFPGYAFSMSTVGGGSEAENAVGHAFLVVGAPLVVTIADKLFRSLRIAPGR